MIWNGILAALGIGGEIAQARTELKRARIEAQADAVRRGIDHAGAWEMAAVDNAGRGWLDEWWTVVLSVPLVLCFVPGADGIVAGGFERLEATPEWFRWCVGASISFAFGRKVMPKLSRSTLG